MFRKVIVSCLVALGLGACHASVHAGPVHAGAGVHADRR
jgi:hypothetical protein